MYTDRSAGPVKDEIDISGLRGQRVDRKYLQPDLVLEGIELISLLVAAVFWI